VFCDILRQKNATVVDIAVASAAAAAECDVPCVVREEFLKASVESPQWSRYPVAATDCELLSCVD